MWLICSHRLYSQHPPRSVHSLKLQTSTGSWSLRSQRPVPAQLDTSAPPTVQLSCVAGTHTILRIVTETRPIHNKNDLFHDQAACYSISTRSGSHPFHSPTASPCIIP